MRWAGSATLSLLVLAGIGCGKSGGHSNTNKASAAPAAAGSGAWTVTGSDPRAALLVAKGCPQCHSISTLGIKSAAEVGPDLTTAAADVQSKFGVKLEAFLQNPTGTMQVVLGSMIQLSPAERDSVIRILEQLHEEQEERGEREPPKP